MKNLFYTSPKYLQNLKGIKSSASEIDKNILFSENEKAQKFINNLKGSSNIAIIGDSITVGAYNDNNENVYSQKLAKTIKSVLGTKNIGFVTAYSNYQSFPIFHNHSTTGSWTPDVIDNETLCGK